MRDSLLDISVPDHKWRPEKIRPPKWRPMVSGNRVFARQVGKGSFAVIPRPGQGVCHIGKIDGPFELVDDPEWANDYLCLRRKQGLPVTPEKSHIGDIVQTWPIVKPFKTVPFTCFPRWISFALLSQKTIGWINDRPDGGETAVSVLEHLYEGGRLAPLSPTVEAEEIEARLLAWTSPSSFEHLVCGLLQLEEPDFRWWHVGGSGDGGTDGLAADNTGQIVAALQCKWKLNSDPYQMGKKLLNQLTTQWGVTPRVYVASLYHKAYPEPEGEGNVTFLTRPCIAELLLKHKRKCSLAKTLGIA